MINKIYKAKEIDLDKENEHNLRQKMLDSIYDERIKLAKEKMIEHKLDGWHLTWDNAKTRLGHCSYRRRVISFSKHYIWTSSESEFLDTVLHEIAHALAGPQAKHGPEWKRIAISIGCSGNVRGECPSEMKDSMKKKQIALACPCGKLRRRRFKIHKSLLSNIVCKKCKGHLNVVDK